MFSFEWLKNNRELINVAVSRPRDQLIVLSDSGNLNRLHQREGSDDLYELVEYVKANGQAQWQAPAAPYCPDARRPQNRSGRNKTGRHGLDCPEIPGTLPPLCEQLIVLSDSRNLKRLHQREGSDDLYELVEYVKANGASQVSRKKANSRALGIKHSLPFPCRDSRSLPLSSEFIITENNLMSTKIKVSCLKNSFIRYILSSLMKIFPILQDFNI